MLRRCRSGSAGDVEMPRPQVSRIHKSQRRVLVGVHDLEKPTGPESFHLTKQLDHTPHISRLQLIMLSFF